MWPYLQLLSLCKLIYSQETDSVRCTLHLMSSLFLMFLYRVICHILNQILEEVGMQEGVGGSEQRRNSPALKSAKEFTDSHL